MERLEEADPPDPDAIADIDVRGWVDGPGQPADRVPAWIRDTIRAWDRVAEPAGPGHRTAASGWTHRPPPGWPSSAARSWPWPGRWTSPRSRRRRAIWPPSAPDARAVVWDDVAHMIGMEQPDRLATEILTFVGDLPPW